MRKRAERDSGDMSSVDRDIVGKGAARLLIPVTNRYHLRQIAGMLRRFADDVDFLSRRQDLTERELLLTLRVKTSSLQVEINELCDMKGKHYKRRLDT